MTPIFSEPLAHIKPGAAHRLVEHLEEVGALAADYAKNFGSAGWGRLAGLWHDGGKYAKDFQDMIRAANGIQAHVEESAVPGRVDHSSAGAVLAYGLGPKGYPLAFVIAGHHAGIADFEHGDQRTLKTRMDETRPRLAAARAGGWNVDATPADLPAPPPFIQATNDSGERRRRYELWVRMLFSALVDADFLDTERFFDATRSKRRQRPLDLTALAERLDAHIAGKAKVAQEKPSRVNELRQVILEQAREAALLPAGVFSLAVPTGGGKTLTSLAFALRHAVQHGLERVIVAIPYTSIIEQTAKAYRAALGPDAVVEHHSNIDPTHDTAANRIASENWDAAVVVTTNVQLFESLFSNRPGRCRKLHRIARSVLILDEAQTIPVGLLLPILDVLRGLARDYGTSIVLSTATQPALKERPKFRDGLCDVRDIVPDPQALAVELHRARVTFPPDLEIATTWPILASRIVAHPQALAIVHRRQDARDLLAAVDAHRGDKTAVHLSTWMCAAHRAAKLSEVRAALDAGAPVTLIATQLVEAGVDIDFPRVFRALAGLDAIAQAAGRCNREGRMAGMGEVEIFLAPTEPPRGILQQGFQVARGMLKADPALNPLLPQTIDEYFRRLLLSSALDEHGIQTLRESWSFRQVAKKFTVIDDDGGVPVVVPYGDGDALEALRKMGPTRHTLRAIQRFLVPVPARLAAEWVRLGVVSMLGDTVAVLDARFGYLYDDRVGLRLEASPAYDPALLIM